MLRIQLLQCRTTRLLYRYNATLPAGESANIATRRKEPRKRYNELSLKSSQQAGKRTTGRIEPRERLGSEEGQREDNARWAKSPWKMKQQRHSQQVLNLVRKGKVSEAEQVLQQMKKARLKPDVVVYNSILTGYSRQGDFKQAFKTFNELKKRGLLPTDRTYTSIFAACGAAGLSAAATLDKIREEMERRDIQPNTITVNALISALALCGRQHEAVQIYLDMEEKMLLKPDLCTFGGLLMTMSKDQSRGMTMAQGVWSEIKKAELKPDLYCYNMLLQVLRDGGLEDSVEGEAQSPLMHTSRQPPLLKLIPLVSTDTLKGLVEGFTENNKEETYVSERDGSVTRGDEEETVLTEEEDMEEWGRSVMKKEDDREGSVAKVNSVTVASEDLKKGSVAKASSATVASEDLKKGSVAISERVKEHCQGSVLKKERKREVLNWKIGEGAQRSKVYVRKEVKFVMSEEHSIVLSMGSERANEKQPPHIRWLEKRSMEALFAAMKQNLLHPDIHTFHLLAHLTLDPAHLLVTMGERRVAPDVKLMVAAVTQQARQLHNLQGAWVLLEYCRGVGLDLGQAGYQALASGCVKEQDAMTLLNRMQADQVCPNQHVMGTLIGRAVRDHSYEYLTSLLRVMMHIGLKPNAVILSMLESAAAQNAKTLRQRNRLNGFRGFHRIWKNKVCPQEDKSQEKGHELKDDFYVS